MISDHVPASVLALRTESNMDVLLPWFERSLDVPGDVCEFGCFRGTLSIKLAFYFRASSHNLLHSDGKGKTVYCFDTFEGFTEADPGGGFPSIGAYSDNENAFEELTKWSTVIPLWPVRGDVRETCEILTRPLSFVWFDLDVGHVMEEVRRKIWHLITPETIIGVDDYGREECPTVMPWAHRIQKPLDDSPRLWDQIEYYPAAHIAFYRKIER